MNTPRRIRVLLVDDHPVVRAGVGAIISYQDDMALAGEASSAAEAVSFVEAQAPDVALVDLGLPDRGGVELIGLLRAKSPFTRFIVLTGRTDGNDIARARQEGAHGYLFKNSPVEELLAAIRTVARGGQYVSPAAGRKSDEVSRRPALTSREHEVLHWLVRGDTNQRIAERIGVSEDTVKFHVKHVFDKLGVDSRSKAITQALRLGIATPDET